MTHLTQIQKNSIRALLEPMTENELNEVLDLLMDEALKREWPGYEWECGGKSILSGEPRNAK